MSQTRRGSLIEVAANLAIGACVAQASNLLILPHYGFTSLDASTSWEITAWYTLISIARQFVVRRLFNRIKKEWNHVHEVHAKPNPPYPNVLPNDRTDTD